MNPVAFRLFGLEVRWYGILIAVGAFLAVFFCERLAKQKQYCGGMYPGVVTDLAMFVILFGVIGARTYYVLFQWDYYRANPAEIINIRQGGLAIYGGILVGILTGFIFSRVKKIRFFTLADVAAPGIALAQGIGRWGNFINGEAHGGPTNVPWAIVVDGQKVHPTFFYESFIDISLFVFLYCYLSKRQKFEGQLFFTYFIIYGIGRFFVEGMRTDSLYLGTFRVSQLVSLLLIVLGLMGYWMRRKNKV